MGKKKNKIAKITEEQYFAYIAGLKNGGALFNADGAMLIPDAVVAESENAEKKQGD